jgi:hypothetical protein
MNSGKQDSSLVRTGVKIGAGIGLVAALAYVALLIFYSIIFNRVEWSNAPAVCLTAICLTVICVFVVPAIFVGTVTGWLIAVILSLLHEQLTQVKSRLVGMLVCAGMALPLNLVLWFKLFGPSGSAILDIRDDRSTYFFLLGIPSLIYVVAGGQIGAKLYLKVPHLVKRSDQDSLVPRLLSYLGVVTVVSVVVGIAALATQIDLESMGPDRNDCGDVSDAFLRALLKNDSRMAKALVVPEQWSRIDTWMAGRKKFYCGGWDVLEDEIWQGGAYRADGEDEWYADYTYTCWPKRYSLSIDDIILKQTEEGCQVIQWGRVCESGEDGYTYKCDTSH